MKEGHALYVSTLLLPMRGRYTYAILKMMNVEDTIARDVDGYVAIAVRLGRDRAWRGEIVRQTRNNKSRIYDDPEPMRELERFIISVCDCTGRGPRA